VSERHAVRGALAVPVLGLLGAFFSWGLSGLPPFGHYHGQYGHLINAIAVPQRHTTNAVTAVVFDYRGFDTLGEEFILFAAVMGVVLLLRSGGENARAPKAVVRSEQLRLVGALMVGAVVLVGLWLIAFGYVTPGGGFQGGVVVAAGILVVYLAASFRPWQRLANEHVLDPLEGLGVGSYAAVGVAGLIAGAPFLHNLLGPGTSGTLLSGGSIAILNWATALEVAAANVVLYAEFIEHYIAALTGKDKP
jgi:multicomponent Na+:H+ antiporter subunit B